VRKILGLTALLLLALLVVPATARASTSTMSPEVTTAAGYANDTISSADPDTNYGSSSTLKVEETGSVSERAILSFMPDIPPGSTVNSVKLKLMPTKTASVGVSVYGYTSAFSEDSLTWNTSSSYDSSDVLGTSSSETAGSYTNISLPTTVLDNENGYTAFLVHATSTSSTGMTFDSRAVTADPPELVVNYTPPRIKYSTWVDPLTVGVDDTTSHMDSNLTALHNLGVNNVELTVDLSWLCSSLTSCDFADYITPVVDEATSLGMSVTLQVHGTPSFINSEGTWYGPTTSTEKSDWATLFAKVVSTYGTTVSAYEVWNEPDNGSFWLNSSGTGEPNADDYADLLQDAFASAKAVNPQATIVGGDFSRASLGFLTEMYAHWKHVDTAEELAANHYYFDILGMHPYSGNSTSGYSPATAAGSNDATVTFYYYNSSGTEEAMTGTAGWDFLDYTRMYALVNTEEGIHKDLAFGEFGYTTAQGNYFYEPNATRASYLTTAYDKAGESNYVRYMTWYKYFPESGDGTDESGFAIEGTTTATNLGNVATSSTW
jgi:hypothetical protein